MVAPVLPVHAREIGASGAAVGLTFSAFAATQLVVSPFAGRLADRYGRKPFILVGTASYVVAALGWLLVDRIEVVIALRALTGLGSGLVFSLALAYIGDLAPPGREGRYMGTFGVFDFLGFGIGPVVSGVVRDAAGFDAVFVSMAGLLALSGVVVATLLPRRAPSNADGSRPGEGDVTKAVSWAVLLRDAELQGLFLVRAGYSFAFGSAFSFLAVYLDEEIGATATMVGLVLAGQELFGGLLQPAAGPLADRVDRRWMVAIGASMVAGAYVTIGFSTSYAVILGSFVVLGGVGSAVMGVASMARQVDVGRRLGMATTMSLSSAGFAFGVLAGSLAGGAIVDALGTSRVFVVAAFVVALGALMFVLRTSAAAPRGTDLAGVRDTHKRDSAKLRSTVPGPVCGPTPGLQAPCGLVRPRSDGSASARRGTRRVSASRRPGASGVAFASPILRCSDVSDSRPAARGSVADARRLEARSSEGLDVRRAALVVRSGSTGHRTRGWSPDGGGPICPVRRSPPPPVPANQGHRVMFGCRPVRRAAH